ncbi:MAG: nucleotidyltransferase domain-containing protein [Anaerolineae bacterium]|nr:nucleotidyltransferase domain-containing protein [Anaerolineae bacterium]MDK1081658.1 nucleotidyltransferase domain-containing protein [Anaerolineae bacterium]
MRRHTYRYHFSFCQRYHVKRLALFGSVLRKDFNQNSDVDVLASFDPSAQIG